MTKQEIAEIIERHTHVNDEWGGTKLADWKWSSNVLVDGIDDAAQEIASQLAALSWAQWIPVSERLPKDAMYLVLTERNFPVVASYNAKHSRWQLYIPGTPMLFQPVIEGVTHWMELPPAPDKE